MTMDRKIVEKMSLENLGHLYQEKEELIMGIADDISQNNFLKGSAEYRDLINTSNEAQRDLLFIQKIIDLKSNPH